jgi:PKHD-type hydroxylase
VTSALVASFPPSGGGLSPAEVAELRASIDDEQLAQGQVGGVQRYGTDDRIRTGTVQFISHENVDAAIFSHLFTLACVANKERGWNFSVTGPAPSLQATSYSGAAEEHYDWHMDWGVGRLRNRKISVIAHLSDPAEFDGGILQLTNGSTPVDAVQNAGTVTVFPAFLLHRVTPVTRGRRLGAVSWILGEPFV